MKFWKHILITIFSFIGIASTVLYTSCNDDPCLSLRCKNGGACVNGYCNCPAGYEGGECENRAIQKYLGAYYGIIKVNETPPYKDSAFIFEQSPVLMRMYAQSEGDIIQGIIGRNNEITAQPESAGTFGTTNIILENGKLTLYVEKMKDGKKYVYTFIGDRQK